MDEIQERIASLALEALARYGFVLAGGQSLQVHGLVDRPSADLDLFTDQVDAAEFARAVREVAEALWGVTVEPSLAVWLEVRAVGCGSERP
jgi:hypothetical protein